MDTSKIMETLMTMLLMEQMKQLKESYKSPSQEPTPPSNPPHPLYGNDKPSSFQDLLNDILSKKGSPQTSDDALHMNQSDKQRIIAEACMAPDYVYTERIENGFIVETVTWTDDTGFKRTMTFFEPIGDNEFEETEFEEIKPTTPTPLVKRKSRSDEQIIAQLEQDIIDAENNEEFERCKILRDAIDQIKGETNQ